MLKYEMEEADMVAVLSDYVAEKFPEFRLDTVRVARRGGKDEEKRTVLVLELDRKDAPAKADPKKPAAKK